MIFCPGHIIIEHLLAGLRQRSGRNFRLGNRGSFNQNAQCPKAGRDPDKSRIY
ncbi:hypothetical protein OUHCRE20_20460 [Enterobacter hormaechei subsp. steigerwaltii]|uniref:Uncharacterized protein n=1 Tax=Enterobacter cloacae TaxID=550 RepID=A0ABD0BR39_ENTCL|nr:hypothetical protein NIHE100087_04850 [Enterobacter hormaechei]GJJ82504.1 hypothetical protein TUM16652_12030 [Enterobacter cloacae]GJJ87882.1 hypothetical protein TUM16653_13680 [Enterobacter cloacae]